MNPSCAEYSAFAPRNYPRKYQGLSDMRISRQFHVGQYVAPKRAEILRKLQHGGLLSFVYALTRVAAKEELTDIYAVRDFRSEAVQRDNPLLIGIAIGKKGAFQVAQAIIAELHARNGTVNIDASFDTSDT